MKKFLFILCFTILSTLTYSQPGRQNNVQQIFFLSPEIGWINTNINSDIFKIYKTTNAGRTWIELNMDSYNSLGRIVFITENIGYMTAFNKELKSRMYKTSNGGLTWEIISNKYILNNFLDVRIGFAMEKLQNEVGDDILMLVKTMDGGLTWDPLFIIPEHSLAVWYHGVNDITFVGGKFWQQYNGFIKRTNDLGLTLKEITFNYPIEAICYINSQKGFASGGLYKTIDSGKSWNKIDSLDFPIVGITFTDSLNGYAFNSTFPYTLYKTTDAGETWISLIDYQPSMVSNFYFVDKMNGFGFYAKYFCRTTDGGYTWSCDTLSIISITSLEESSYQIKYYLQQNYPNPFNPSTKIKYSLPKQGLVTIKVYDVLGKEIAQLVNEEKPSGEYEVEFYGSSLSSGIYYYKIQAGEFVQTKKMVLMK